MFFMWNNHPLTKAYPDPIRRLFSIRTEISGDDTREMISRSSFASPEPQIVTIDDDSNEPTMPYGFWTAVSNCSPTPERLEPAAQSFEYPGNDGNSKQHRRCQPKQL